MNIRPKYSFEGIVASVIFIVLFVVILIQIFGRTPWFHGPVWTEEVARWLWVWMAFIATAEVERRNAQLSMGFLAESFSRHVQFILYTVIDLVYLAALIQLSYVGYKTVLRTMNNESVTLPVSDALLYASAFVASFFIIYRVAQRVIRRYRHRNEAENLS